MSTFFTSDLHFGHSRVIEYCKRPFQNVQEMDEALIRNWNAVVAKKDLVHVVGDLSFHGPLKTLEILSRLNGSIVLVKGNHDKKLKPEVLSRFAFIKDLYTAKVEDPEVTGGVQRIVLCHYAMRVWDGSHRGVWHLYGHSHGSLPDDPCSRSFDIGVDNHDYHPVSYERVKAIMATKRFEPIDHHGQK